MNIRDTFKNYVRNRRAMAELYALDDKGLADVGVSRAHIRIAVKGRV